MSTQPVTTRTLATLDADDLARVADLVAAAERADGVRPVNEQAWLDIVGKARDGIAHQLAERGGVLVGYLHLDSATDDTTGQLVVHPDHRRRGVASAMLGALGFDPRSPEGASRRDRGLVLKLWSFGDLPAGRATAEALAYAPVRELLIMERDVEEIPEAHFPPDVTLRTFTEDDVQPWLRVNARAFAHHPEQGMVAEADLRARMAEPWFDPAGFLVATRPDDQGRDQLVGFHWTKIHDADTGEVYVIGVDPDHAGGGLGRQLLHAGLAHLRDRGVRRVILYVEGDQTRVVGLYLSARFAIAHRDVLWSRRARDEVLSARRRPPR
ncbi:mycothiol synthase [Mariniluteicoccus endophyticus]